MKRARYLGGGGLSMIVGIFAVAAFILAAMLIVALPFTVVFFFPLSA